MFKKAVKTEAKLRLAIAGPAGSGKTYTALSIATHLGGPIAVIDTEHGSASKYADLFDFDVAEMHAPYHPDKYLRAIKEAADAGYKVIILDSMSHAWNGEGGLLELADEAAKAMKTQNSFAAWKSITPIQNRLVEGVVSAPLHLIATMRSKMDYVLETDKNGKTSPKKVGMAPEQRNDMPYEFDVVLDMNVENSANVTKTRCSALAGEFIEKPGRKLADTLVKWLSGAPAPTPANNHAVAIPAPVDERSATWQNENDAMRWGWDSGIFNAKAHCLNAYRKLENENHDKSNQELYALWIADVERRVNEKNAELVAA